MSTVEDVLQNRTPHSEKIFLEIEFKPISIVYILDLIGRIILSWVYLNNQITLWLFSLIFFGSLIIEGIVHSESEKRLVARLNKQIGPDKLKSFAYIKPVFSIEDTLISVYFLIGIIASLGFSRK